MLQYITHTSDRYTIPQQVRMVIDGGCRWIQLRMKHASDDEVEAMRNQEPYSSSTTAWKW